MALLEKDLDQMKKALFIIRQQKSVDSKYKEVQCPHCSLIGWWYHPEEAYGGGPDKNLLKCVACETELNVCDCGTALTEENRSEFDTTMCKECRKEFQETNDMCPVCEADLEEIREPGVTPFKHCPNGHIDPIPVRMVG